MEALTKRVEQKVKHVLPHTIASCSKNSTHFVAGISQTERQTKKIY